MARQLTFHLPARPALGRASFYLSPANETAAAAIGHWRDWPGGTLLLVGPAGAGKTHLAHVWAAESGAQFAACGPRPDLPPRLRVIVEDLDRLAGDAAAEEAVFHLHNRVRAARGRLLVTGRSPPGDWPFALPDLASRLQAMLLVRIAPPDDALLAAVMTKHFADRQLLPPPWLIPWLLPRMPRSFAAAARIVAQLDADALERGAPIDRAAVRRVLDSIVPPPA